METKKKDDLSFSKKVSLKKDFSEVFFSRFILIGFILIISLFLLIILGRRLNLYSHEAEFVIEIVANIMFFVTFSLVSSSIMKKLLKEREALLTEYKHRGVELETSAEQMKGQSLEQEQTKKAMISILEDLEEEKENMANERDKVNTILYSIGDAVFVIDAKQHITAFNKAAEELSTYKAKSVIGVKYTQILNFVAEDNFRLRTDFLNKSITEGVRVSVNDGILLIIKSGKKIPIMAIASPLKGRDETIEGCVVIMRDITMEKEIDKVKTEFVSLASHQLRTPLTAISWYTEMLLNEDVGKINSAQKGLLDEIIHGNKRMVDLVNSLLNVSRVDLGTFIIEPVLTNIFEVADSVINELKPQYSVKKLKITKNYDKTIPQILADPKLMRIIFQNVISNAVKYTPSKGKIDIHITKKQPNILIKVTDTGYGIPNDAKKKIFQKLFRADNIKDKDADGNGLGLYLVKAILDESGGKIWFKSIENKGTTFFVTIPLKGMVKKKGQKELT